MDFHTLLSAHPEMQGRINGMQGTRAGNLLQGFGMLPVPPAIPPAPQPVYNEANPAPQPPPATPAQPGFQLPMWQPGTSLQDWFASLGIGGGLFGEGGRFGNNMFGNRGMRGRRGVPAPVPPAGTTPATTPNATPTTPGGTTNALTALGLNVNPASQFGRLWG